MSTGEFPDSSRADTSALSAPEASGESPVGATGNGLQAVTGPLPAQGAPAGADAQPTEAARVFGEPIGPGAQLARAREALGWSIAEVARQTKLHPKQVEALEQEAFDRLRSPIYVRGFARNYARLVGVDVPALMRALDERCPMPDLAAPDPLSDMGIGAALPSADRPTRRYVRVAAGVLLAIGVVAVVDRFWSPWREAAVSAPEPVALPAVAGPASPGGEAPADAAAPASDAPAGGAVPSGAEAQPAGASASAASPARTVRVSFDRESWVEIRDASGQVILSGMNRAGTEQVVRGLAPLSVVVGNASGVRIDYEARRVDLQPHTQVNVARLTLD